MAADASPPSAPGAPASAVLRKLGLLMLPWLLLFLVALILQITLTGSALPSVPEDSPNLWTERALGTLLFLSLARALERFAYHVAHVNRTDGHYRISNIGLQILQVVIYFVAVAATINVVFDQSISAILAASGVAGIVIGFALRGLVSDVFSGIAINLDPAFRTGDFIEAMIHDQLISGTIIEIQWRCTIVRDWYNNDYAIPNGELSLAVILNRSRPSALSEFWSVLPVPLVKPIGELSGMLEIALERVASRGTIAPQGLAVDIDSIAGNLVTFRMRYQIAVDQMQSWIAQTQVLRAAEECLALGGISLGNLPLYVQPLEGRARVEAEPAVDPAHVVALEKVPLLLPLSGPEIRELAKMVQVRSFRAGATIFSQGHEGETMLVILQGGLDVLIDKDGQPARVARLWPGDCVGEMSLLTGASRTATVRAQTSVRALEIDRAAFRTILLNNAQLVEDLAQIVEQRAGGIAATLAARGDAPAGEPPRATIMGAIRRLFGL